MQTSKLAALAALGWLLTSPPASAAELFADDFELGSVSRWPQQVPENQVTLAPLAAASHRGQFGLRMSDDNGSTGTGPQGFLGLVPPTALSQYYFRFWLNLHTARVAGEFVVCEIESIPETAVSSVVDLRFTLPAGQVSLAGYDQAGTYQEDGTAAFTLDSWHLVEGALLGLGTGAGSRRLWVDGVRVASGTDRAFSGVRLGQLKLGEPYADKRAYRGDFDIDDFRAGADAPASRLVLTAPASATEGDCVPLGLSLVDSEGVAAAAPYEVQVAVAVSGTAGELFTDSACTHSTPSATVSGGAPSSTTFLRPATSGSATITASHPDFLPAEQTVQLAASSTGTGAQQSLRGWSCDVAPVPAALAWSAVLTLLARRRRSQ